MTVLTTSAPLAWLSSSGACYIPPLVQNEPPSFSLLKGRGLRHLTEMRISILGAIFFRPALFCLLPGALFLDPLDAPVWELAMRGITNRHDDSRPGLSTGDLEV